MAGRPSQRKNKKSRQRHLWQSIGSGLQGLWLSLLLLGVAAGFEPAPVCVSALVTGRHFSAGVIVNVTLPHRAAALSLELHHAYSFRILGVQIGHRFPHFPVRALRHLRCPRPGAFAESLAVDHRAGQRTDRTLSHQPIRLPAAVRCHSVRAFISPLDSGSRSHSVLMTVV